MRIGQRYILVAHAHDGRVEVVEAMLHRDHREFAGDRADRPAFLDDDAMVRLLEAGEHRRGVERADRAELDDLGVDPKIGRVAWRDRVCQYDKISGLDVSIKKNRHLKYDL